MVSPVALGYTAPMASDLTLTLKRERHLPMRGASAVAAVDGALFVVEDDRGIYRVTEQRAPLWAGRDLHPALGDLEGLAVDEKQTTLWALSEEDGAVLAISLRATAPRPTIIGHLPRPGTTKNKGFEGLRSCRPVSHRLVVRRWWPSTKTSRAAWACSSCRTSSRRTT